MAFTSLWALLIAVVTGLKYGSSPNYFNEFIVFGSLLIAVSLCVPAQTFLAQTNLAKTMALLWLLCFIPAWDLNQIRDAFLAARKPGTFQPQEAGRLETFRPAALYLQQNLTAADRVLSFEPGLCVWLPRNCTAPAVVLVDLATRRSLVDYTRLRGEISSQVRFVVQGEELRTSMAGVRLDAFQEALEPGKFGSVHLWRRAGAGAAP